MLCDSTIIVFSDDWGGHPSSTQHLLKRFLLRNRVVWLNTVGLRLPRLTCQDGRKLVRKLLTWLWFRQRCPDDPSVGKSAPAGPEVVDIPLAPLALGGAARKLNARLLRRAIDAILRGPPRDPGAGLFIVSTLPLTADLAGVIPGVTFVYYLVDDYGSWPGTGSRIVRRMDRDQARRADLIVAASRRLAALHEGAARRPVEYLPHGVDVEHFASARAARAARRAAGRPPAAQAIFFGAIDERIDQGLFAAVAASRPDVRFLAVGPGATLDRALGDLPNVARRDAVPYAELPGLLAEADVAVLPYVAGEFGARLSPLKAREALAAGLPVVATDVPELRALAGAGIHLGQGPAEVLVALGRALAAPDDVPPLADFASASWEARAERLSELLSGARAGRPTAPASAPA